MNRYFYAPSDAARASNGLAVTPDAAGDEAHDHIIDRSALRVLQSDVILGDEGT